MHLSNMDGVIGKSFRLGYGNGYAEFKVEGDTVSLNMKMKMSGLDAGNAPLTSSHMATKEEELTNLKSVKLAVDECTKALQRYTDNKIAEMTGGTTGTNVMLNPIGIGIDKFSDTFSAAFGSLPAGKFVDRIIFEVDEAFSMTDGSSFDISIGTVTNKEAIVPRFSMSKLASTYIINVCKTLYADTDFVLYTYKVDPPEEEEPVEPFEQVFHNDHSGVAYSMTSDADGNNWTIEVNGDELIGDITNEESFGPITGNFIDFGFNVKVEANHRYRVVQQNAALAVYDGLDEFISNIGGVWTKDKTYDVGDDINFIYEFLLTQKESENDYAHIYIYDLSSETPETAIYVYHIHNGLNFSGDSPAASQLQVDFMSADEAAIGIVKNDENQFTITLSGEAHSRAADLASAYPDLTGNFTSIGVYYPKAVPNEGIRIAIYNPIYSQLAGSDGIRSVDGIYYADMTLTDSDEQEGIWIDIPIGTDKSSPIIIAIVDLATNEKFLVGIDNELTILDAIESDAGTDEPAVASVYAFNLDTEPEVLPFAGDTGIATVRILSF